MVINSGVIIHNNLDKLFQWNFSPTSLSNQPICICWKKTKPWALSTAPNHVCQANY